VKGGTKSAACALAVLFATALLAADNQRATNVRETTLVTSPGGNTEKVMALQRGSSLIILEHRTVENQPWVKVSAAIPGTSNNAPARESTGWAPAKPIVSATSPDGDEIVYGEAVDSEQQAQRRGGRKGAAEDAMRLYYRVAELFPNSPLAGEALWRSADIRWQLERSRGTKTADNHYLEEVMRRFPKSKWADLAAYDLLDSQLCGEWNGLAECPEKEATAYERYAREHPQSPKAPEALYNAAYRQGALADMYRSSGDKEKSNRAHAKALALAQEVASSAIQGDWKLRAAGLMYKLQQNIPLYGVAE
jgi:hypothetical protein